MAIGGREAAVGAEFDVRNQIIAFKRKLAPRREALQRAHADARDHVSRAVDIIRREVALAAPWCRSSDGLLFAILGKQPVRAPRGCSQNEAAIPSSFAEAALPEA